MTPKQLRPESFSIYPPLGKKLAVERISLLQRLPLGFLPLLLREVIVYDWKFPIEKKELERQFTYLQSLSPEHFREKIQKFESLQLSPELERMNWVSAPSLFSEQLTAHLWATHQIEVFRTAAVEYVSQFNSSLPAEPLPMPRLGMVVIGQGVTENSYPLFRKLGPHGAHYTAVLPDRGFAAMLDVMAERAQAHSEPYSHWYIDGGARDPKADARLTAVSYASLTPVRSLLQNKIQTAFQSGVGSEVLRTRLAQMRPEDVGLDETAGGNELNHFKLSLLTEGSGTQIFSTTFVQWAAREVSRRVQPLSLLARFSPRQREKSMRELLTEAQQKPELDPAGSLIDADMGAYYTWLNMQRLAGADQSRFLVWFENHNEALVIAPGVQRGARSGAAITVKALLKQIA